MKQSLHLRNKKSCLMMVWTQIMFLISDRTIQCLGILLCNEKKSLYWRNKKQHGCYILVVCIRNKETYLACYLWNAWFRGFKAYKNYIIFKQICKISHIFFLVIKIDNFSEIWWWFWCIYNSSTLKQSRIPVSEKMWNFLYIDQYLLNMSWIDLIRNFLYGINAY